MLSVISTMFFVLYNLCFIGVAAKWYTDLKQFGHENSLEAFLLPFVMIVHIVILCKLLKIFDISLYFRHLTALPLNCLTLSFWGGIFGRHWYGLHQTYRVEQARRAKLQALFPVPK